MVLSFLSFIWRSGCSQPRASSKGIDNWKQLTHCMPLGGWRPKDVGNQPVDDVHPTNRQVIWDCASSLHFLEPPCGRNQWTRLTTRPPDPCRGTKRRDWTPSSWSKTREPIRRCTKFGRCVAVAAARLTARPNQNKGPTSECPPLFFGLDTARQHQPLFRLLRYFLAVAWFQG